MSQENVEIVRQVYDAMNRGDIDAAVESLAPAFECDLTRSISLTRGVLSLDQMRSFLVEWAEHWASSRYEADEFVDAGEHVVTPFTNSLEGRAGIEVQARGVWVWTIRDGAITRLCLYQERQEALDAVGVSDSGS